MRIKYISMADIKNAGLSFNILFELISKTLNYKKEKLVDLPPKPAIYPRADSFINVMPAYIKPIDASGAKLVSYFPGNSGLGFTTINSLIILCESETGLPKYIIDGNWITAYRTALVSAFTVNMLGRKFDSLSIIGAGVQAESHIDVFCSLFSLKKVYINSNSKEKVDLLIEKVYEKYKDVSFFNCSKSEALSSGDIIVSATPISKSNQPFLSISDAKENSLILPIDYASSWDKSLYVCNTYIMTDDKEQFLEYFQSGYFKGFSEDNFLLELTDDIFEKDVRVAINLGIGAFDIAIASYISNVLNASGEIEI